MKIIQYTKWMEVFHEGKLIYEGNNWEKAAIRIAAALNERIEFIDGNEERKVRGLA